MVGIEIPDSTSTQKAMRFYNTTSTQSLTKVVAEMCIATEKFDENYQKIKNGISGDVRRKGRFLRKLNLANFCYSAKHYTVADIHLNELLLKIDEYNLAEWEPALSVSVWQLAYLNNSKLLNNIDNDLILTFVNEQQISV